MATRKFKITHVTSIIFLFCTAVDLGEKEKRNNSLVSLKVVGISFH